MSAASTAAAMAAANDCFRAYPETGMVITTWGVDALGPDFQLAALAAVKAFDGFGHEDDPYGSHDFGIVTVRGQRLFWKIDLYADPLLDLTGEEELGINAGRILTIMLPEEY